LNPRTYFAVPANKRIVVLGLIVKNEDGSAQTEDIIFKQGAATKLAEVLVNSKIPFIEQQIDKTVVNVQADINAIGSSAFEILQKAPGLSITGDDVINMSGKAGVNVLIDGRPTQMSSKELANYLRSLPGSTIEKIELISNPSSRFDAQGNAGIINFGQQVKKFEYQLGVRVENAAVSGNSVDLKNNNIKNPDTNYINIFPTAFVSYKLNEKNIFALSYSKRINRPDYQSLNPFETIYDIYTSEKGNPYLRPQYTNNFELKYTYKYAINVAVGFNHTKDYSQTISRQIGQLTTATNDNIGTLDNAYLSISSPLPINKWWDGYLNVTGFINHYKGMLADGKLDENVLGMNYYIQQNFKPGKGWSMQLSSWYNAGTKEAIFKTSWLGSVDFGIKKSLLNSKASIRLTMLDIFNTQRWQQKVQFANQDFTYRRKWESRGLRLQISWSFGKTEYKARERETSKDANRIKIKS